MEGARKIRSYYNKKNIIDFFILPPLKQSLKKIDKRGRDNSKEIKLRLSYAIDEMSHYKEYKYVLINENVHKTVDDIRKIIEYNELIENRNSVLKKN